MATFRIYFIALTLIQYLTANIPTIALKSPAFDHFIRDDKIFYLEEQSIIVYDIIKQQTHTTKTESFSTAFSGEMPNGELAHFGHTGTIAFYSLNPTNFKMYLEMVAQQKINDGQGTFVAFDETFISDTKMFLITGLYTSKILGWYPSTSQIQTIFTSNPQRFIEASKTYALTLSLDGLVLTRIRLSDFKEDLIMKTHLYEGAVAVDYAWYEIESASNLFFVKRSDLSGFLLDLQTGNMDLEYKSCQIIGGKVKYIKETNFFIIGGNFELVVFNPNP